MTINCEFASTPDQQQPVKIDQFTGYIDSIVENNLKKTGSALLDNEVLESKKFGRAKKI